MSRLPPSLIVLCLTGCMVSPDPGLWKNREGGADTATADARSDHALTDGLPADAGPDQPRPDTGPPQLTCSAPTQVGTSAPTAVYETALRADGLELVTKTSGQWYATQRTAQDQPFGDWSTTSLLSGKQDPTFFSIKGIELGIVARSPGSGLPRVLELCTAPSTCSQMTIQDAGGQDVTDDMDGASVAVLPSGDLLMAHNVEPSGLSAAEIYLAQPSDPNDLSQPWVTRPESGLNQADVKEDDPALSPDGLVIIYSAPGPGGDNDLYVSIRSDVTAPFPAASLLVDLNSSTGDSSPDLAALPASGGETRYELFFSSKRDGDQVVYRSECSW